MISTLIVNHNGEAHLARCLTSLGPLPRPGLEVLLVDNASSDRSLELVRRDFPAVRILALDMNCGFAAANNQAAAEARGEHLLLLNSDAWLVDDCLDRLLARLEGDPTLALVCPTLHYPDGTRQISWAPDRSVLGELVEKVRNRFEASPWVHARWLRAGLGASWYPATCMLLRREAFAEVGGFDAGYFLYFEDADLCLRLRRRGWQMALVEEARAVHCSGGSPGSGGATLAYRQSQVRYYEQHRPRWEQVVLGWHLRRKFSSGPVAGWLREKLEP